VLLKIPLILSIPTKHLNLLGFLAFVKYAAQSGKRKGVVNGISCKRDLEFKVIIRLFLTL